MRMYFITHPVVNIDPRIPPNKWSISEEGWKQVRNLSKELFWKDVDTIFASTEPKANKAAEFWSKKFGIPFSIVDDIQEIDRSSTGFVSQSDLNYIIDRFYSKPEERVRGWESANECLERMVRTINRLTEENRNKNIVIVSHGAIGNLYACKIKGIKPSEHTGQTKIGSWFVLDLEANRIVSDWKEY